MVSESYVNLETARLLRKKGFPMEHPEVCTQALVMRWLREEYNIDICIIPLRSYKEYLPRIEYEINNEVGHDCVPEKTYEQACEAAINYCLENLI